MRKTAIRRVKAAFTEALGREPLGAPVFETHGGFTQMIGAVQELRRLKKDWARGKLPKRHAALVGALRSTLQRHAGHQR